MKLQFAYKYVLQDAYVCMYICISMSLYEHNRDHEIQFRQFCDCSLYQIIYNV